MTQDPGNLPSRSPEILAYRRLARLLRDRPDPTRRCPILDSPEGLSSRRSVLLGDAFAQRSGSSCIHLIVDPTMVHAALHHPASEPVDLAGLISDRARQHGFDPAPLVAFLRSNPITLSGGAHDLARSRYLDHHQQVRRRMRDRLAECVNAHFEQVVRDRPRGGASALLVRGYVDQVMREIFESEHPSLVPLYIRLTKRRESIFSFLHHPARLAELSLDLKTAFELAGPGSGQQERALLLAYVLQGRDPLLGALGSFAGQLVAMGDAARDQALRVATPATLFENAAPVNYIARVAAAAIDLAPELMVKPGDLLILGLAWAARGNGEPGRGRLAFGSGRHQCAGRALALDIAGAWLQGLRRAASAIDWGQLRPERLGGSVFVRWDEAGASSGDVASG